jgi:itaconyl-CoA hydratase
MDTRTEAPKEWRGRFLEDFDAGDAFRSRLGRTITETDNIWFTCLTMNTNQVHFNHVFAVRAGAREQLPDGRARHRAQRGGHDRERHRESRVARDQPPEPGLRRRHPLWAESEILAVRRSQSNPGVGIVTVRTRGVNQRSDVDIEFVRSFMVYSRTAVEAQPVFPATDAEWTLS